MTKAPVTAQITVRELTISKQNQDTILGYDKDDLYVPIPEEVLILMDEELDGLILTRTPLAYAEELTATLVGCYPENRHPSNAQPIVYAIIEELTQFPPDIARDAMKAVRRKVKAFPTIADVYEVCEKLMAHRHALSGGVNAMLDECERLDQQESRRKKDKARHEEYQAQQENIMAEAEKLKAEEEEKQRQQRRRNFKDRTQKILTNIEQEATQHFGDAIEPGMLWKIIHSLMAFNEWDEDRIDKNLQAIWERLVLVSRGDPWAFETYKRGAAVITKANGPIDAKELCVEVYNTINCHQVYQSLPLELRMERYPEYAGSADE